jgi:translation initiation factor IF-3
MAKNMHLDLVEISPNAQPPVCRIVEYGKFLYEQKKKDKDLKKKNKNVVVKEIRFGPNTDEHDYNFKLKNAIQFLKDGFKIKAFVQFKGREIVYKQNGELLLLKFTQALLEFGKAEQLPILEGKKIQINISPKKK